MLKNFFEWTKNNKIATFVIFFLALILLVKGRYDYRPYMMTDKAMYGTDSYGYGGDMAAGNPAPASEMSFDMKRSTMMYPVPQPYAPVLNVTDRKIITEGYLSLQVTNVEQTIDLVKAKSTELGGYLVNSQISRQEFSDSATVSVRVPSEKVEEFISYAKENAVKVVSENTSGSDITDQYVDLDTRLAQLTEQKAKLEAILKSAVTVQDIMAVQPYITQIQSEIDSVKGQTNYINGATKASLVTMYLSTDELSLPYTPEMSWRPQVIFKNAMRSLIAHIQLLGTAVIWIGVYSAVIVPALTIILIIYLLKRRKHQ
jgi:hypothetical protein